MTVVQRSPDVGLALRMQRLPQAAPPAAGGDGECECNVYGAGWLLPKLADFVGRDPESLIVEDLPGGGYNTYDTFGNVESSKWVGVPVEVDGPGRPMPVPGPTFQCVELQVSAMDNYTSGAFFGALQGTQMCDVSWLLSWNFPHEEIAGMSASGHTARAYGNVVHVYVQRIFEASAEMLETLTAVALCKGVEVARMKFTAHRRAD